MFNHRKAIKEIACRNEHKNQSHVDSVFSADQIFFEADFSAFVCLYTINNEIQAKKMIGMDMGGG